MDHTPSHAMRRLPLAHVFGLCISIVLSCFSLALNGAAQSGSGNSVIEGYIRDGNGGLIADATATARNEETGLERTAATDDRGRFSMSAMPVGRYEVKASAKGFEAVTRTGVTLTVGETAIVEITLQPASGRCCGDDTPRFVFIHIGVHVQAACLTHND